jgi:uroporphyrinogen decarboxylase
MSTPWERFKVAARRGEPDQVPVALIVDSPWLPGYAGIDTRDYYLFAEQWWAINRGLAERFPEAVWIDSRLLGGIWDGG